jgi:hypothetical protein
MAKMDAALAEWKVDFQLAYFEYTNKLPNLYPGQEPITDIILTKMKFGVLKDVWYYYNIDQIQSRKWSAILHTVKSTRPDIDVKLSTAIDLSAAMGMNIDNIFNFPALWIISVEYLD